MRQRAAEIIRNDIFRQALSWRVLVTKDALDSVNSQPRAPGLGPLFFRAAGIAMALGFLLWLVAVILFVLGYALIVH